MIEKGRLKKIKSLAVIRKPSNLPSPPLQVSSLTSKGGNKKNPR
jgi:hypothetical protein